MKFAAWIGGFNLAVGLYAVPFDWLNYTQIIVGTIITLFVLFAGPSSD